MGDVIQFVDSISATPTVLLDLNNETPFAVSHWSAPPPPLRRASSSNSLSDGDNVASSTYGDRTLTLSLDLFTTTQDVNATSLQTLARLLDREGAWLKWQPTGMTKPVFFRTKRADLSDINEVIAATAARELTVVIPAAPFAFGLPETGTMSVANTPGSGMLYTWPVAVKGDVATPLNLDMESSAGLPRKVTLASLATDAAFSSSVYLTIISNAGSVPAGWTKTNAYAAGASAITGTCLRLDRASGATNTGSFTASPIQVDKPGDYRLFIRARGPLGSSVAVQGAGPEVIAPITSTSFQWIDLGVIRAPNNFPLADQALVAPSLSANNSALLTYRVVNPVVGAVDINAFLLIPAGLDQQLGSTFGQMTYTSAGTTSRIDAISEAVYNFDVTPSATLTQNNMLATGAFPRLVPGAVNTLFFVYASDVDGKDLALTDTQDIGWLYYPRYLYVRPATT